MFTAWTTKGVRHFEEDQGSWGEEHWRRNTSSCFLNTGTNYRVMKKQCRLRKHFKKVWNCGRNIHEYTTRSEDGGRETFDLPEGSVCDDFEPSKTKRFSLSIYVPTYLSIYAPALETIYLPLTLSLLFHSPSIPLSWCYLSQKSTETEFIRRSDMERPTGVSTTINYTLVIVWYYY